MDLIVDKLSTLPSFLAYFAVGVVFCTCFTLLYINLSPHRDFALIRFGNTAASIEVAGAMLGFTIPLAAVIHSSPHLADMIVWGVVTLIVQIGGYFCARLIFPDVPKAIVEGRVSEAIFLATLSLSLGILTAACMMG